MLIITLIHAFGAIALIGLYWIVHTRATRRFKEKVEEERSGTPPLIIVLKNKD